MVEPGEHCGSEGIACSDRIHDRDLGGFSVDKSLIHSAVCTLFAECRDDQPHRMVREELVDGRYIVELGVESQARSSSLAFTIVDLAITASEQCR
jgi:hypothetical protein